MFAGPWPREGVDELGGHLQALRILDISNNHFSGPWLGLEGFPLLRKLHMSGNWFTGTWPEGGQAKGGVPLQSLWLLSNRFSGVWPQDALGRCNSLEVVGLSENLFSGTLVPEGLAHLFSLEMMFLGINKFAGSWAQEAVAGLKSLQNLQIEQNRLSGSWSSQTQLSMRNVRFLCLSYNLFTGTWPLVSMGRLQILDICGNSFAGTFATSRIHLAMGTLRSWSVYDTNFEGSLGYGTSRLRELMFWQCGGTRMEGRIPPSAGVNQPFLKLLSLRELHLEASTIPQCLGRMKSLDSLVLGHGLSGTLPVLSGTVSALSVFHNNLEGPLPNLQLMQDASSYIVAHSNLFSCRPPSHGHVGAAFSVALLGNYFCMPNGMFPEWIQASERGDAFVVSDRDTWHWFQRFLAAALCFVAVVLFRHSDWSAGSLTVTAFAAHLQRLCWGIIHAHRSPSIRVKAVASLLASLQFSIRAHRQGFLCSILLVVAYMQVSPLLCAPVLTRWQAPVLRAGLPFFCLLLLLLCGGLLLTSFLVLCKTGSTPTQHPLGHSGSSKIWCVWLLLCFVVSFPGTMYSTIHSIPGFLHVSKQLGGLLTSCVAGATALLTSICLPYVAGRLPRTKSFHTETALLVVGKLLALPLIPALVTYVLDEHCLGMWAQVWTPCTRSPSPLDRMEVVPRVMQMEQSFSSTQGEQFFQHTFSMSYAFTEKLLSKSFLCSSSGRDMMPSRCLNAILDRCVRLLLANAVHAIFTTRCAVMAAQRPVTLQDAWVRVVHVWGVSLVLGFAAPLLVLTSLLDLVVHYFFLFGFHDMVGTRDNMTVLSVQIPEVSLVAVLVCYTLAQSSFIAVGSSHDSHMLWTASLCCAACYFAFFGDVSPVEREWALCALRRRRRRK